MKSRSLRLVAGLLGVLWLGAGSASAAPGDLDPGFADDGKLRLGAPDRGSPGDLEVLGSGTSLVCLNGAADGRETVAVARLERDGSRDRRFGRDGVAIIRAPARATTCRVEPLPGGGSVVAYGIRDHSHNPGFQLGVARLTSRGHLDREFDENGVQTLGVDDGTFGGALAVSPDGAIYVGGPTGREGEFVVYKLDERGRLDAGFGAAGKAQTEFGRLDSRSSQLAALELDAAGRVVLAGTVHITRASTSKDSLGLARLTAAGQLDESFSGDGMIADWDRAGASDAAIAPDGRIATTDEYRFRIDMTLPDGTPDATFGGGGSTTVDFADANAAARDIAWVGDSLAVSGSADTPRRGEDFAVARLLADGTPDPRFSDDGKRTIDFGRADNVATAMGLGPGRRLTLAGATSRRPGRIPVPVLARLRD